MPRFIGEYSCGYSGCETVICLIADSIEDAEDYMREGYEDYMAEWEGLAQRDFEAEMEEEYGEDWESEIEDEGEAFYNSQAYENYRCDGCWTVRKAKKIDLEGRDSESDWLDIRRESIEYMESL